METPSYPSESTAYKVLQTLHDRGILSQSDPVYTETKDKDGEPITGWVYRSHSPFREKSDSNAIALTIQDDLGEFGTYTDFVTKDSGSLYEFAELLGLKIEKESKPSKSYTSLKMYAQAHGANEKAFINAGYVEHYLYCNYLKKERLAITFPTATGKRSRYLDGLKPKYHSPYQYQPCWYGLERAINIALKTGLPLMLVNGEPSVIAAQAAGLPAFCLTGGSEKKTIKQRYIDALKEKYPTVDGAMIWVILDCDRAGRIAAPSLAAQLRKVGWDSLAIDLGQDNGYDIADLCRDAADPLGRLQQLAELAKSIIPDAENEHPQDAFEIQSDALHPLTIERAALGIALYHPEYTKKQKLWSADLFSNKMYAMIAKIVSSIEIVTIELVWQECQNRNVKQITFEELKKIQSSGLDKSPLGSYLETLREALSRRLIVQSTFQLQNMARNPEVPLAEIHLSYQQTGNTIKSSKKTQSSLTSAAQAMDTLWSHLGNPSSGIMTNIGPIDKAIQGIDKMEMLVLGGRPGGGKTALAIQLALQIALQNYPVLFFTQEVPIYQMQSRLITTAMHSWDFFKQNKQLNYHGVDIPFNAFIKNNIVDYPNILEVAADFAGPISELPLTWEFGKKSALDIEAVINEHYEAIQQPMIVIIDYIQYMEWPSRIQEERLAIAKNMDALKKISEDTDKVHHVQVLSQMKRSSDLKAATDDAMMSDAGGSSQIESSATTMLMLPTKTDEEGKSWVGIPKSRNGQTGSFPILYNKRWGIFS